MPANLWQPASLSVQRLRILWKPTPRYHERTSTAVETGPRLSRRDDRNGPSERHEPSRQSPWRPTYAMDRHCSCDLIVETYESDLRDCVRRRTEFPPSHQGRGDRRAQGLRESSVSNFRRSGCSCQQGKSSNRRNAAHQHRVPDVRCARQRREASPSAGMPSRDRRRTPPFQRCGSPTSSAPFAPASIVGGGTGGHGAPPHSKPDRGSACGSCRNRDLWSCNVRTILRPVRTPPHDRPARTVRPGDLPRRNCGRLHLRSLVEHNHTSPCNRLRRYGPDALERPASYSEFLV